MLLFAAVTVQPPDKINAADNTNKYFLDMLTNALYAENSLKILDLSKSNINGEIFKSFVLSMYKKGTEEPNPNFHITTLNVSNNKLGYNGIECLCKALKVNKTVQYLNVFHNLFDVNGARRFQEILAVNSTLEELDIGYNRMGGCHALSSESRIDRNR